MSSGDDSSQDLFADKLKIPEAEKKPEAKPPVQSNPPEPDKIPAVPVTEFKDKIIVVDDSPTILAVISGVLKQVGFNAITYRDGRTAIADLKKMTPDEIKNIRAIFSDFEMPNITGLEILKEVREIEAVKALPFIMVTANTERDTIQKAAQLKVNGYLLKPVTAEALVNTLNSLFPGRIAFLPVAGKSKR